MLGCLEVVLPHQVVGLLDADINAAWVDLLSLLHCLDAFALGFFFLKQVGQAHLSDACVGLSDVSLDLCLWRGGFEWIFEALLSGYDSFLECLDGLYSLLDIS